MRRIVVVFHSGYGHTGARAQTPADACVDEMPAGGLETARLFGRRVAEVAARFRG